MNRTTTGNCSGVQEGFRMLERLEERALVSGTPLSIFAHGRVDPGERAAARAGAERAAGQGAVVDVLASAAGVVTPAGPKANLLPAFDEAEFDDPVQNVYFPLVPGTTFVYEVEEEEGTARDEVTVTNQTLEILGVTTIVVRDVESIFVEEQGMSFVLEDTLDHYAYDNAGNVWYFGEDTTAFEYDDDWNLIDTSTEGSWRAGEDSAEPGILIPGQPVPGLSHQQEFAEDVAEDMARVLRVNANVSIELGDFENVLVTKEWSPLEPGHVEQKYYAPGVGLILITEHRGRILRVELAEIIEP